MSFGRGIQTGNNELIYFTEKEQQASGIDSRFFRPLISEVPEEEGYVLENTEEYLLDLRDYFREEGFGDGDISEEQIFEQLDQDGYLNLLEYLRQAEVSSSEHRRSYLPDRPSRIDSPDIVVREIGESPEFFRVNIDDVVIDRRFIGIKTESKELSDYLCRLLNTPLYRELVTAFAETSNSSFPRLTIRSLREVPIITDALSEEVYRRLGEFLPLQDDNDLVRLNQILIESCSDEEGQDAVRRFIASRDDFAWSWLLSLPELEEFQDLVTSDREAARSFVIKRFDESMLDDARRTFDNIDFFGNRQALLTDLLMEFEQGHYRGFLAGITLQFEGVLTDLVEQINGEVYIEDNDTKFVLPSEEDPRPKNLAELISTFFDGVFSRFLDETVRQRRNQIAHGDMIENDRELAIHFFVSFYALCNAALNEYVRRAESNPAMVNG